MIGLTTLVALALGGVVPVLAQAAEHPAKLDAKAYEALVANDHESLAALRAKGADPARYARTQRAAVFDSLRIDRRIEVLEFVLNSGANPNTLTHENLRVAPILETRDPEKLRLLLQYGADVSFKDNSGYTALARVLFTPDSTVSDRPQPALKQEPPVSRKLAVVKLLLDHGADVNADHGGLGYWGALGLTRREDKEVIDLFLERGATLTYRPCGSVVEEFMVDYWSHMGIPAVPQEPGPITIAVDLLERDDLALALLARAGRIDTNDKYALVRSVRRGWTQLALALLRSGADPNVADADGIAPLDEADRRRDQALVRALIAAGAKPGASPVSRVAYPVKGEFATSVAKEIDQVVLFDSPRFEFRTSREDSLVFFPGKDLTSFESVRCEQQVRFDLLVYATVAGHITVGMCRENTKRVRDLARASGRGVHAEMKRPSKDGVLPDRSEITRLGWEYETRAGPSRSKVYYLSFVVGGHGAFIVPTAILVSENGDQAVIVQVEVSRLCDGDSRMRGQTALCSDTKEATAEIAQRLFSRSNARHTHNKLIVFGARKVTLRAFTGHDRSERVVAGTEAERYKRWAITFSAATNGASA